MNINESWHGDAPTSPFVNKEKRCAFKRPSYTGIPVLVSCIVLKGPLKCCLRAVSQLGGICSHFRTEFGFLQFVCVFLPLFLLKGPSFTVSLSFWSLGLLSSGWWSLLFITGCCCTVSLLAWNTTTGTIGSPRWSCLGLSWLWQWQLVDI